MTRPDPGSVGQTRTRTVRLFDAEHPLELAGGARLAPVDVAFETYGELSPARDNAVFVCHALTGDAHAAGFHEGAARPGWWDNLIGPGKPLDTDRLFVVCANLLGGCQGTTGPASINPATGRAYGLDFPLLQMADFVRVHRALLAHLGVERLLALVGGSLGGMQVLQWALEFPEEVANAVVVAASSRLSAQNIAFSAVGRESIMRDEGFAGGGYVDAGTTPATGLSIARMMAHITYLSEDAMTAKFGRRFQEPDDGARPAGVERGFGVDFAVESYLHHQGASFLSRFDALSYLYLTRVMDYFDPLADPDAVTAAARAGTQFLVVSFDSDWRFSTEHSRRIVRALERGGAPVSFREIASPWGHDSFLLPIEEYHATVRAFMERAEAERARLPLRRDLAVAASMVPPGSRVLDLGCGDGSLLRHLIDDHGCRGTGVEIDADAVLAALAAGLAVVEVDVDEQLDEFPDDAYDVVVLSKVLQATRTPAVVLEQMRRLAPLGVVSVPNFGLWRHRWGLLRGRMPMSRVMPYRWFDTPNIHHATLPDLEDLFHRCGFDVERRVLFDDGGRDKDYPDAVANLLAASAVYLLRRR